MYETPLYYKLIYFRKLRNILVRNYFILSRTINRSIEHNSLVDYESDYQPIVGVEATNSSALLHGRDLFLCKASQKRTAHLVHDSKVTVNEEI